jgi:hypothetical protein
VDRNIGYQPNLAQMTLDELYNKSHEKFMLSRCQENATMAQKG